MGWHGTAYRSADSRGLRRAAVDGIPCYEGDHVFDVLLTGEHFRPEVEAAILRRQIRAG